jgi:methylmalonyl-CoA/ethylmalonyl-CoA epimerase
MCVPEGGSNIELMSPADPEAPLSQSLQRFLDRRGEGLFALMLEAPDPDAEASELARRGLNVLPLMAGADGRDVHPNSTHGVLIRVYPVASFKGEHPGQVDAADAPGLTGIARVIIAIHDLENAINVYGSQFVLNMDKAVLDQQRGVRSAVFHAPTGGVIEVVSAQDESRPFARTITEFLNGNREGMYALVLQSGDIGATESNLVARGVKVGAAADSERALEIDRQTTFGALLRIEST